MRNMTWATAALVALAAGPAVRAETLVLPGPGVFIIESGHRAHGIEFTALQSVTLDSFVYHNQGKADLVELVNMTSGGIVEHSLPIPAGNFAFFAMVGWQLDGGDVYRLLGTTTSNGLFNFTTFP